MAKATQPAASAAPVWTVIKSAKAPKISARASSLLHYDVGGLFSKHWLSLDDILARHSNRWRSGRCLFEAVPISTVFSPPSCGLKSYWSPPSTTRRSTGSVSLSDWSTQLGEPANMDK
ncbi:hypothetical protein [Aeromonas salmonicida]|uniref:hypothetical protein n=1 Tax=Aeromonas salmonicida TaxID=645 RepID=UPI0024A94CF6|nr:hypothetical protein [Aeromonas salmonicida]MDM5135038.1 hypothetical protein [Aeromonas salmonicida]WHF41152.1 hypothetical protein QJ050_21005 [Aeromonas salmonicida]